MKSLIAPARTPACRVVSAAMAATMMLSANVLADGPALQARSGEPLPGLSADQLDRFFKGRTLFMKDFTAAEGLGPTFNQTSCAVCHSMPAVGGSGSQAVTRFGALNLNTEEYNPLAEFGGSLFQMSSIHEDCEDAIPSQQQVNDLLGPDWGAISNDPAAWFPAVQRVTNSALGGGLVEAIADDDILAHATKFGGDPWPGSPPPPPPGLASNVNGHAHLVFAFEDEDPNGKEPPPARVGRMGWKAQVATVLTFSADASRNELGITNRFLTQAPPPKGDLDLLAWCENIEGLNDTAPHPNDQPHLDPFGEDVEFIDRITHFQRFLAQPPQTPRSGMTGEDVFVEIGCAQCHIPSFTTRNDPELEDALRNKVIRPYSDFLLHDMGIAGDLIEQGDGLVRHMRTPALWGIRDRDPLLHDGRVGGGTFADRIYQGGAPGFNVIHWHSQFGSAARPSALKFMQYVNTQPEKIDALMAFLESLGRWEFDYNGDVIINDADFEAMIACYTGTGGAYVEQGENPMDHPCAVFDIAQNGSIDHTDFELFLTVYEGEQSECDLWTALAEGVAPIGVPVPDECFDVEPCVGDLTGSGGVGVPDLLALLGAWGPCPREDRCPADLTGSGSVGVPDLLVLLSNWGPCPN